MFPKKLPKHIQHSGALRWKPFPHKRTFDKPLTKAKPRVLVEQHMFEDNPWKKGKFPRHAFKIKAVAPSVIPEITPIEDWPILLGDRVEIMVGPDTGKQGTIRSIGRYRNQVKITGLNLRAMKIETQNAMVEDPLHYNEVKLVDPATGRPTDVEVKYTEEGEWVRVCKHNQTIIPKPIEDKPDPATLVEGPADTPVDAVNRQTYIPSMLLFHEEIMLDMNIPMSIPKRGPERRDLIMAEVAEDVAEERERERFIDEEEQVQQTSPLVDKIKSFLQGSK